MPAQLKPPIALPTPSTLSEEETWSLLVATQLTDVRKIAESWRNGLVASIGLIAAFSVIKGQDDMSGLESHTAYAVGLLLLLALACAAIGTWASLVAAYGTPSVISREAFHNLGGINGYRLELARRSTSKLWLAQAATVVTLLLLTAAVGLTWYGPRSTPVILEVERKSLPNVCGKLASSADGYIDIKPSASAPVRVNMADLIKVRAVKECP